MKTGLFQIPMLALGHHGGARVLVDFANEAARRGARVRFLVPMGGVIKNYDRHDGVEIKEIGCAFKGKAGKYVGQLLFLFLCPFYMRRGVLVANFFPTVYSVWLARLLFGCPYIYLVQDIETWFAGLSGHLLNEACRLTWRSSRMVATCPSIAEFLTKRGYKPWRQVRIGVSEAFFGQNSLATKKSFDIICFPRREPWKRFDRLQRIVAAYNASFGDLRVLCVGQDDTLLAKCGSWGTALKPNGEEALIAAFDSARVLLFTSEREGLGLPPLEGMARGLPCVVFENDGAKTYLNDESGGFLIDPEDEDRAVEKIHALLHCSDIYAAQSASARRKAAIFRTSAGFAEFLDDLGST